MSSLRIVYVKTRVRNYYGLAGIRNEYCKLIVRGEAIARCNKVFAGECISFDFDKAISCHLITKQEYQEATGDYTCDIDEIKKPVPPSCREIKNTMPVEALLGISIGLILLMVISLCAN